MKITMQFLDSVRPACKANSFDVVVDCKMTTGQMHDALLGFLEHISGTEWAQWVREIDSDSPEMVPCRHEFYQGTCAHCALPAEEFRKSRTGVAKKAKEAKEVLNIANPTEHISHVSLNSQFGPI